VDVHGVVSRVGASFGFQAPVIPGRTEGAELGIQPEAQRWISGSTLRVAPE
jgi:hypothetical protein